MWVWVVGLLGALGFGAWIGAHRFELLSATLNTDKSMWGTVWMHLMLSLLSIGAPLWFAWMASKQIGQRFRLAEDYAYKASVAKAYEGYRKEAARLNPAFEARLFDSALSRLEEAPLRLVESDTHGSPWHEFANSKTIKQAVDAVPNFAEQVKEMANKALGAVSSRSASPSPSSAETSKEPSTPT
jgi:cytoskeletal protein RodZ